MVQENIERYCENHGISISEFERKCKLGNGLVRKWRSGVASPTLKTLAKIEKATGVSAMTWMKKGGIK